MSPVLSRRSAEALLAYLPAYLPKDASRLAGPLARAIAELEAALRKRKPSPSRKAKAAKRSRAMVTPESLRRQLGHRANLVCECGCGRHFNGTQTVDHFFGRARAESLETCWLIRSDCHQDKSENRPSAAYWLERFRAHAIRHSYWAEAARAGRRLDYVRARAAMPAAPGVAR